MTGWTFQKFRSNLTTSKEAGVRPGYYLSPAMKQGAVTGRYVTQLQVTAAKSLRVSTIVPLRYSSLVDPRFLTISSGLAFVLSPVSQLFTLSTRGRDPGRHARARRPPRIVATCRPQRTRHGQLSAISHPLKKFHVGLSGPTLVSKQSLWGTYP